MTRFAAVLFCSFASLAGCRTHVSQYYLGAEDYTLATREGPDGQKETWRLEVGAEPALRVRREREVERPALGLRVTEIDKAQAERRGVKPYCGLLVTGLLPGSSAAEGGVLVGDVLKALGGQETVYLPQVAAAEAGLRNGQVVAAKVLRGQEEIDLQLTTRQVAERVSEQEVVALEVPEPLPRPYAGVGLRGIPAGACERIFGVPRQAVIVTDVEVGSPAWLGGIRAGDVIDTVDGAPVPDVHELTRRLAAGGESGASMTFGVRRGPGQRHEGRVELADYSGESGAWIPLVFKFENGTVEDHWSIGPFGLVMSNRNRYIANASTRRPQTRNVFSALLGLFRVETTPDETEVRLLWIIRFDT